MAHLWRSENSFLESVLSFHRVSPGGQVIGLGKVPLLAEPSRSNIALCQKILTSFDKLGACSTSQLRSLWDVALRRNWLVVSHEEAFQMSFKGYKILLLVGLDKIFMKTGKDWQLRVALKRLGGD